MIKILGLLGMYFDAVVVEVETFLLLFRLALAILCTVLWCIWRVILFPLYAETRYYIGKKATLNHHREAI